MIFLPQFSTIVVSGLLLFATSSQAGDWPQWRGPDRTGHVPDGVPVPAKLPAEPKFLWKFKIGESFASPVVASGKLVYIDNQEAKETVHAIDSATGKELWRTQVDDVHKDSQGPPAPRCTPLIDGDRVYAQSCKGEFQCLSLADGKAVWRVSFTNDFGSLFIGEKGQAPGATRHGYNASPLIDGENIFVTVGSTNGASLVCFRKKTGDVVWKSQNDQAAYAAPIMATIQGVKQIVYFTCDGVIGLEMKTGKLLWRTAIKTAFARHAITPVVFENLCGGCSSHQAGLIRHQHFQGRRPSHRRADLGQPGNGGQFCEPRGGGQISLRPRPDEKSILEIPTGKVPWTKDGYFQSSADKSYAGFIVMGKNILILTDGGELVMFAADPVEFKEISRLQVSAQTWCIPAFANGKLYLRDGIRGPGELMGMELNAN